MGYYSDLCVDLRYEIEMLERRIELLEQALCDNGDEDVISDINEKVKEEFEWGEEEEEDE